MPDSESEASKPRLKDVVTRAVAQYLDDMGNTPPDNLHERILREVEVPLITTVLNHTGGNQSRAAAILGMTRSTLRNRIRRYGL
ncbi:MAG: helix-turn-helix domain-containing protein [Wenzhouxiangellaceae bacterium]